MFKYFHPYIGIKSPLTLQKKEGKKDVKPHRSETFPLNCLPRLRPGHP